MRFFSLKKYLSPVSSSRQLNASILPFVFGWRFGTFRLPFFDQKMLAVASYTRKEGQNRAWFQWKNTNLAFKCKNYKHQNTGSGLSTSGNRLPVGTALLTYISHQDRAVWRQPRGHIKLKLMLVHTFNFKKLFALISNFNFALQRHMKSSPRAPSWRWRYS